MLETPLPFTARPPAEKTLLVDPGGQPFHSFALIPSTTNDHS